MRLPEVRPEERWGLCLSGGADSTALLFKCLEAGFPVVALHFNHAFEDEEGDADEVFVKALCARLGVTLEVGRCLEPWTTRETKEVFARRHRMGFFADCVTRYALTGLLLAHHAGDRAEHVVLRLARGCGAEGLTRFGFENHAPWDARVRLVRPLLDETHEDQVAYLKARGETWQEDVSNSDVTIPRNAIRATLPNVLPHFVAGVNAAADVLAEENAFITECAEANVVHRSAWRLEVKPEVHPVLLRRVLRGWLSELTRRQTEALLTMAPKETVNVSGDRVIERLSATQWQVRRRRLLATPEPLVITCPGTYRFGPWQITVGDAAAKVRLPLPLTVRTRRAGDRFRPRGMQGSRKLQDVLTDLKIPAPARDAYPLFCDATGTILAVPGMRPAALPEGCPCVGIEVQRLDD